ncbi:MAG: GIY-YIG nuclease family protein, partial [Bacteroidia bacterium]
MYSVYILFSSSLNRYYVGQTQDMELRLARHNTKQVTSTKNGVPWKIVYIVEVSSRSLAMNLENKIKKRG